MAEGPTIPQMVNRSNDGHRKALLRIAAGLPVCSSTDPPSGYRGMRTILTTLRRWGCIEDTHGIGGRETNVTDTGRLLLDSLDRRAERAKGTGLASPA